MLARAVVMEAPGRLALRQLALQPLGADDVAVDVVWSGVSTGTEGLLWRGEMPSFPGMGYPLVPGYEAVGRVVDAGADARGRIGDTVFVPGASCFEGARGLFGGQAARLVVPARRAAAVPAALGADAALLALAATAHHALVGGALPGLIIGHGVLGRLLARLTLALGGAAPTVWELRADRRAGAVGYSAIEPDADPRRDYGAIVDASGSAAIDPMIARLAKGGELVLAGFYDRIGFAFAPAFLREARLRVAAEWAPADLAAVLALVERGALDLSGLISHGASAADAATAYPAAFSDPTCVKMVLCWDGVQ